MIKELLGVIYYLAFLLCLALGFSVALNLAFMPDYILFIVVVVFGWLGLLLSLFIDKKSKFD